MSEEAGQRSGSRSSRGRKKTGFSNSAPVRTKSATRYTKLGERVVCHVGGDRRWAPGSIQSVNEDDPTDPTATIPYIVKVDAPLSSLVSVPSDDNECCRPEVCFGQREGAIWFTLFCMPVRPVKLRRFAVGARVACAVEDGTDNYSMWAAGTVTDVDWSIEDVANMLLPDWSWEGIHGLVPYKVQLDSGTEVLVHNDQHWLVRDLALQEEGVRTAAGGVSCLARLERRQRNGAWEDVDHMTCRTRACGPPDSDDEKEN